MLIMTVTASLTLAGCSDPGEEFKDVRIATEDETKQAVTDIGQHIATVAGGELETIGVSPATCTGRNDETSRYVYYVQGSFQVAAPQERHGAILAELWQSWQVQGYKQQTYKKAATGAWDELAVKGPDEFWIRVMSTEPPTALSLLIHSPCLRSPTPRT